MILVSDNCSMINFTQGHKNDGGSASPTAARRLRPRRSVVAGSMGLLVGGVILSVTALPAMANISQPTANLVTVSIPVTTTTVTTTTTIAATTTTVARVVRTTPTSVARVAAKTPAVRAVPVTLVTTAINVPTTVKTVPVTKATIVTTVPTTVKAAPVAKTFAFANNVPAGNIVPNPNFLVAGSSTTFVNGVWTNSNPCVVGSATAIAWPAFTNDPGCTNFVLAAINSARAHEGVKAMVLPSNWYNLTTAQQLFVLADLERVDRGLPPYLGINAALSANAQHAALTNSDPSIAAGFPIADNAQGSPAMGGAWSGGFSPLAADYIWMYDDGWGGSAAQTSNIACTSAHAAGCWAHRLELLGSDPGYNPGVGLQTTNCEMGVGFAMVKGNASYVDLIEVPSGALPPMTFTWANNVLPYLS